MTVKDKAGRILTSENPVLCEMWKRAGYKELPKAERERSKAGKQQAGREEGKKDAETTE